VTKKNRIDNKKRGVGIQLYTLRELMAVSVEQTLRLVAQIGFDELEFAGYFEKKPSELRTLIDQLGLSAPSGHVLLDSVEKNPNHFLDIAATLGHRFLVIPIIFEKHHQNSISGYQQVAERLNIIGELCKKNNVQLAYHNHAFEFEIIEGKIPYNIMLSECDPDLVDMELDLYWVVKAGLDPITLFTQAPGRFKLWHVKDMDNAGDFADVGHGTINFKEIFAYAQESGMEHAFVERDHTKDPEKTARQSYQGILSYR
jgi:sugar phosphate isomerase/epimerase